MIDELINAATLWDTEEIEDEVLVNYDNEDIDYQYEGYNPLYEEKEEDKSLDDYDFIVNNKGVLKRIINCCKTHKDSITIPSNVKIIPDYCFNFDSFENIRKITLPEGLLRIGISAFSYLPLLEEINIPSTVKYIDKCAFEGCISLKEVNIPYGVKEIEDYTFRHCNSLKKVTVPSTIKEIGAEAFSYCKSLTSITLPETLQRIDRACFLGCRNIEHINGGGRKIYISGGCISGCEKIKTFLGRKMEGDLLTNGSKLYCVIRGYKDDECFTVPSDITKIMPYAFAANSSYKKIIVGENVKEIGSSAFESSNVEEVELNCPLQAIKGALFFNCHKLKKVTLPSSIKRIGGGAFYNCEGLERIDIPSENEEIGKEAFYNCKNLKEINLGENIREIGPHAFAHCSTLKEVVIPPQIKEIKTGTFLDCSSINKVSIPDSLEYIETLAFETKSKIEEFNVYESGREKKELKTGIFPKGIKTNIEKVTIPKGYVRCDIFTDVKELKEII